MSAVGTSSRRTMYAIRRDADDVDEIRVSPNGLFVAMNGCTHVLR
jgi:hypothetical protein